MPARLVAALLALGALAGGGAWALAVQDRDASRLAEPRPDPVVATKPALRSSRPVRLVIHRLGITTALLALGKNTDGTLEVPSLAQVNLASWYRYGATPGERGAAVIAGHIDSQTGPAVFHRLAELRPGDRAEVVRRDRRVAVFRIDRVVQVPKDRFPTRNVYGDLAYSGIRLITCGGSFDRSTGRYTGNVIAYGHLVDAR